MSADFETVYAERIAYWEKHNDPSELVEFAAENDVVLDEVVGKLLEAGEIHAAVELAEDFESVRAPVIAAAEKSPRSSMQGIAEKLRNLPEYGQPLASSKPA